MLVCVYLSKKSYTTEHIGNMDNLLNSLAQTEHAKIISQIDRADLDTITFIIRTNNTINKILEYMCECDMFTKVVELTSP